MRKVTHLVIWIALIQKTLQ